jgi:hypothetical protein
MFNISVTPVNSTDQILALQYVVSVEGQAGGDFVAFAFIGDLPVGAGLPSSIFYASCDEVNTNQGGKSLTVQVVGGINDPSKLEVSELRSRTNISNHRQTPSPRRLTRACTGARGWSLA